MSNPITPHEWFYRDHIRSLRGKEYFIIKEELEKFLESGETLYTPSNHRPIPDKLLQELMDRGFQFTKSQGGHPHAYELRVHAWNNAWYAYR